MNKKEKIKILCATCGGVGHFKEISYDTKGEIDVVCPGCDGKGYIEYIKY